VSDSTNRRGTNIVRSIPTIFDPATILDRATYADPYQMALGIVHVIVGGRIVVRDGTRDFDVLPGQFLRPPEGAK